MWRGEASFGTWDMNGARRGGWRVCGGGPPPPQRPPFLNKKLGNAPFRPPQFSTSWKIPFHFFQVPWGCVHSRLRPASEQGSRWNQRGPEVVPLPRGHTLRDFNFTENHSFGKKVDFTLEIGVFPCFEQKSYRIQAKSYRSLPPTARATGAPRGSEGTCVFGECTLRSGTPL